MGRGALQLLLMLASVAAWDRCAHAARQVGAIDKSLVIGWWKRESIVGWPCPKEAICLDPIMDVRIADTRTLSGPKVPRNLLVRVTAHGPPAPDYQTILVVSRSRAAHGWQGFLLAGARPGEEVCIDMAWVKKSEAPLPREARVKKDKLCFVA
jgi:hypothetical protein